MKSKGIKLPMQKKLNQKNGIKTMNDINLYTIGFTKKTAEEFFSSIKSYRILKVIDIRLKNVSQLSGFAKKEDLKYFLKTLCDCEYQHLPMLAPTKDLLEGYKKKKITWEEYENVFNGIIAERKIENLISPEELDFSCFLCSEFEPDQCHRRLVADYLSNKFNQSIIIKHL